MKAIKYPLICLLVLFSVKPAAAQRPDFSLAGFATLNGGTTGGEGGAEVVVSNYADLKNYAEKATDPYIIKVSGTIRGSGSVAAGTYDGSVTVGSNKSIVGMDSSAFLDGVGLKLAGGSNVIIQNIRISFISIAEAIPEGSHDIPGIYSELGDEGRAQILVNGGDLISIQNTSRNIWIDHCELYSEDPAVQPNKDLYDGLIDIKHQTGFITISWCYFHDHYKVHLMGSNDADLYEDRKVTYHHNRYENINSRLPMCRGSVVHVFNNYVFKALGSCVDTRIGACIRVERNYYEQSKNTVRSASSDGFAERIDNREVDCSNTYPYPNECTASLGYVYDNVLHTDLDYLKRVVLQYSGVGGMYAPDFTGISPAGFLPETQVHYDPVPGRIYILPCPDREMDIAVFDLFGRVVMQGKTGGEDGIVFRPAGPGLYLVRLGNGPDAVVRKIRVD